MVSVGNSTPPVQKASLTSFQLHAMQPPSISIVTMANTDKQKKRRLLCPGNKVLVLGSYGVGKAKLLLHLAGVLGVTSEGSELAIRGDFLSRVVPRSADQTPIKLELWHTAGQEKFGQRALPAAFFRRAKAAVIVYDVANRQSFTDVIQWCAQLREHVHQHPTTDSPLTLILVSHRLTADAKEVVSSSEGYSLASLIGASAFLDCCSETGEGVESCIDSLVAGVTSPTELKLAKPGKLVDAEEIVVKTTKRVRSNSAFANAFRKTLTSEDQTVLTRGA